MSDLGRRSVIAVIVTHTRSELVSRCVAGIAAQRDQVDRVIIVNNGSERMPDSVANSPVDCFWLDQQENIGSAGGFSLGIDAAVRQGCEWIWVFQDDDEADVDALAQLRSLADDNPRVGAVGAWIRHGDGSVRVRGFQWRGRKVPYTRATWTTDVQLVDGAGFDGVLIRASSVADCGPPRADFFQVLAEVDFYIRLRDAGWQTLVTKEPLITALSLGEIGAPTWREYYEARNGYALARSVGGIASFAWWIRSEVARVGRISSSGDRRAERLRLRFRGQVDGIRGRMGRVIEPTHTK